MQKTKDLIELKAAVVNAIRAKMTKTGVIESYYNKVTEGTGACFNVSDSYVLRNSPKCSFLSQTDQLLMETEILECDLSAVWTIGRSFRHERRDGDGRHSSEFALLEYEAQNTDLNKLVLFQQEILNTAIKIGLESPLVSNEHKFRLERYIQNPAPTITYTDIIKRLNNGGISIKWGDKFSSEIEETICLLYDGPVQITHYPESVKFFNMYRTSRDELTPGLSTKEYNQRQYTVDCVDFLLPWAGETFRASQREGNYSTLKIKLSESKMLDQLATIRARTHGYSEDIPVPDSVLESACKPFVSYIELFNPEIHPDYESVARSGFGLGMGRLMQFLLGSTSVIKF